MGLVSNKIFFLQKILVNRFFCYKSLVNKNLWQKNDLRKSFTVIYRSLFTVKLFLGKLHKYYSRLRLLKKDLLKNLFFYFLLILLKKKLFFEKKQTPSLDIFVEKFLFSFNMSLLFSKIKNLSSFYFSIILIQKLSINLFLRVKSYFILFYLFIIFFFKKMIKYPSMFVCEFFIDMFLLLNKKDKNILEINNFVFFEKIVENRQSNKFLFLYDENIFKSIFSYNFSIFFKY